MRAAGFSDGEGVGVTELEGVGVLEGVSEGVGVLEGVSEGVGVLEGVSEGVFEGDGYCWRNCGGGCNLGGNRLRIICVC